MTQHNTSALLHVLASAVRGRAIPLASTAVAMAIVAPAWAQRESPAGPTASQQQEAPADPAAPRQQQPQTDASQAEPIRLEEVVVSARRRVENRQTVPIAITAFTQEEINKNQIQTAADLQNFVPSLNVLGNTSQNQESFTIRGIGSTGFSTGGGAGGGPGVVAYFAEVPSTASGPGLFYDLQSLEVLKGPQGTLFGKNTTGGAVLLIPRAPSEQPDGYVQATAGDYSHREVTGATNFTIVPGRLMVRLAAEINDQDGYIRDVATGRDYQNRNSRAGRLTLRFTPTENFANDLIVNALKYDEHGPGNVLIGVNPALANGVALAPFFAAQEARGPRRTSLSFPGIEKSESYGAIDRAQWQITPEIALKNILSYSVYKINLGFDADASPLPTEDLTGADPGSWQTQTETWTEEMQLQGTFLDNALIWQTGAFFDRQRNPGVQTYNIDLGGLALHQDQLDQKAHSEAVYGQATYDLSRLAPSLTGLKITAGYRYTRDYVFEAFSAEIPAFGGFCISGATPPVRFFPNCLAVGSASSSGPSWTLGLDYQVATDTLLYLSSRKGYKSGGFNVGVGDPTNPFYKYRPESATDVELGIKSDWRVFGMAARTNADVFHTRYANVQRNVPALINGVSVQVTDNAARATIQGFELEATLLPIHSIELNAAYSYLDAKYDKYITPTGEDLTAFPFEFVPKHKVSLGLQYVRPLPGGNGSVAARVTYSYQSEVAAVSDVEPGNIANIPDYSLVNLRLDWRDIANKPLDLSFFVTNLNNTLYRASSAGFYNTLGAATTTYGPPRMIGGSLRYHF